MSTKSDAFDDLLHDSHELETFFHTFIAHAVKQHPKAGADVTPLLKEVGMTLPNALKGATITWASHDESEATHPDGPDRTLVYARPGEAAAVGLTIGCVRVGKHKVCLECGWLYCRVVISGRF